jgi:hypothetical protein
MLCHEPLGRQSEKPKRLRMTPTAVMIGMPVKDYQHDR